MKRSIWARLARFFNRRAIERRTTYRDPAQWLIDWASGGSPTASGMAVNEDSALKYTAFYAAVNAISRSVAQLPLLVYRRQADDGRTRATDHSVYHLLHTRPNREQTPFIFRQTIQGWALTWGNGYAEIERKNGRAVALWPLPPTRIQPRRNNRGAITYDVYRPNTQTVEKTLEALDMLHIRTLGDGMVGWSPVRLFRETIGLGLATEKYGASFFANDARPGGVLQHPGSLSEKALKNLRDSWTGKHAGPGNAHRPGILEEGMTWKQTGIPNEDSQFLETRQFGITDIARIFNIPPHKLGDLTRATFSNIEEQSIEYVTDCLGPWFINWEQELNYKLFSRPEQHAGKLYCEFLIDSLLRGDIKSRYEAYAIGRNNGWFSANDIRRKENMNPLPAEQGDVYLVPANMVPADKVGQQPPAPKQPTPTPGDSQPNQEQNAERIAAAHRPLFVDLCGRIMTRQANAMRKALRKEEKQPGSLAGEVVTFYADHIKHVVGVLGPAIHAYSVSLGPACMMPNTSVYATRLATGLTATEQTAAAGLSDRAKAWPEQRNAWDFINEWEQRGPIWADRILNEMRGKHADTES